MQSSRVIYPYNKLTRLEPVIQSKTSTWSAVNLKKNQMTLMSFKLEPVIWSHDNGLLTPCFNRCQLTITWMSYIKDVPGKKCRLHHRVSQWHTWRGRRTVTKTKFPCTDGLPHFLTNGTCTLGMHLWHMDLR